METAPREPPGRGVTIYDVAKVAGVSPSTVSRAFSRPGRVSARTAQHVRQIAADLGYRSEEIFPPPAPTRTQLIGMAVSDITNPFYFPIIRGGERAAAEAGFTLVLTDADECEQTERESLKRALPVVDGIVIARTRLSDTDLRSIGRNVPVVVLNRPVPGLNSVIPDTDRAVRRAVEHLASLGHRKSVTSLVRRRPGWTGHGGGRSAKLPWSWGSTCTTSGSDRSRRRFPAAGRPRSPSSPNGPRPSCATTT